MSRAGLSLARNLGSAPSAALRPRTVALCLPRTHHLRLYSTPPQPPQPQAPASSLTRAADKSQQSKPPPRKEEAKGLGFRPIPVFLGLLGVGLFFTIYGILEYYFALSKWPEPVRTPLRRALRAKNVGEFDRSEGFFKEAIAAALSIPSSVLEPDPLLKLTGIYIAYAGLLEEQGKRDEAYQVLREATAHLGPSALSPNAEERKSEEWAGSRPLTQGEHLRAIGISQKMGHLALSVDTGRKASVYPSQASDPASPKSWLEAAERHLSDALTAMLKVGLSPAAGKAGQPVIAGRDVDLPAGSAPVDPNSEEAIALGGGVDRRGLGVTMESLAEIYARRGEFGIAGNLLIQAISTLLPPQSEELPAVTDQCQAALLMTTVSSHALQPNTPKAIKASRSWSLRALQVAEGATQAEGATDINTLLCKRALAVGSFNLGMLAEIEKDEKQALQYFTSALRTSREIGFNEGKRQASEAIRRIRANQSSS